MKPCEIVVRETEGEGEVMPAVVWLCCLLSEDKSGQRQLGKTLVSRKKDAISSDRTARHPLLISAVPLCTFSPNVCLTLAIVTFSFRAILRAALQKFGADEKCVSRLRSVETRESGQAGLRSEQSAGKGGFLGVALPPLNSASVSNP